MSDFIELTDSNLGRAACAALVERFEASGKATRGRTGGGIDTSMKDSWDLCIDEHAEWRDVVDLLNQALVQALLAYIRKYPYLVLAPLALRVPDPRTGQPVTLDPAAIAAMPDAKLKNVIAKVFRPGTINLQKYEADVGGYPYWHCEVYPKPADPYGDTLHRVLLWSIYLNDGFAEGETEFYHQQRRIAPRTGALLIAPAGFTHTHRGNRPRGGNKYIATSWVLFQRSEALFGKAGG